VRPYPFLLGLIVFLSGCDAKIENFASNDVYALTLARSRSTPAEAAKQDVAAVLTELFGTPDAPRWPAMLASQLTFVDADNLTRAAGPQSSEQDGTHVGLYREHCVQCHGLSGSGTGPASQVLNPYPRDFRHGVFKWKSTRRTAKPTRDDLRDLLFRGVPGTAMPSFALQPAEDIEAIVDYVIYLSVRGEVERRLMQAALDELDYGADFPEDELRIGQGDVAAEVIDEVMLQVARSWQQADDQIVDVPPAPVADDESVARGREIFHGPIANCAACHGPDGSGTRVTLDYDDWTKEYSTRIGLTPTDRVAMQPFRAAGALSPRLAEPRDLADGNFRGGSDPATLFRRITVGIAGTPMPAVAVVDVPDQTGLTSAQIWDLVHYLQSVGGVR
jgi:mono/diheme cytochrome c family protein